VWRKSYPQIFWITLWIGGIFALSIKRIVGLSHDATGDCGTCALHGVENAVVDKRFSKFLGKARVFAVLRLYL
jgi:hypothetical protein